MRGAVVIWVIAAGWLVAGCTAEFSAGRTLDTQQLEGEIANGISTQTGIDATVECPEDVTMEAGNTFECTATADGSTRQVSVTQDDGEGNVSWELAN